MLLVSVLRELRQLTPGIMPGVNPTLLCSGEHGACSYMPCWFNAQEMYSWLYEM